MKWLQKKRKFNKKTMLNSKICRLYKKLTLMYSKLILIR